MRIWIGVVVVCAGCSNPIGPTATTSAAASVDPLANFVLVGDQFPPALQPVVAFLDEDPWVPTWTKGLTLGTYVRTHLRQVMMDFTMPNGWGAAMSPDNPVLRWHPGHVVPNASIEDIASTLLHEARHFDGYYHSCSPKDCTVEEEGAYGIQVLYLEHRGRFDLAGGLRRDAIGR
jgi:hypothetical protein